MAVEKRSVKKKRPGRPATGKRPVIAMRMHPDVYAKICAEAELHKFSISEEAEHQIKLSFEWADKIAEMRRLTTTIEGLRDLMRAQHMRPVQLDQGTVWAEPGVDTSKLSLSVDAAAIVESMKPQLVAALVEALQKSKGDKQ